MFGFLCPTLLKRLDQDDVNPCVFFRRDIFLGAGAGAGAKKGLADGNCALYARLFKSIWRACAGVNARGLITPLKKFGDGATPLIYARF